MGGAGHHSIRLLMMAGTGLSGCYFPHLPCGFSFRGLSSLIRAFNDEACIIVVSNDRKKLRVDEVRAAAFMWLSQMKD